MFWLKTSTLKYNTQGGDDFHTHEILSSFFFLIFYFFSCTPESKAKPLFAGCSIQCYISQNAMLAHIILKHRMPLYLYDPSTMNIHTIWNQSPCRCQMGIKESLNGVLHRRLEAMKSCSKPKKYNIRSHIYTWTSHHGDTGERLCGWQCKDRAHSQLTDC